MRRGHVFDRAAVGMLTTVSGIDLLFIYIFLNVVFHSSGPRSVWNEAAKPSGFTRRGATTLANRERAAGNADKGVTVINGVINKQLMCFRAWL